MNLTSRKILDADYDEILVGWWNDWGFTPPPIDFLSDYGLIIYDEEVPVCAGFIYITNSSVALVNWVISNKEYREKPNRSKAIDELIGNLTYLCKKGGYKYVFVNNNNSQLISRFENHGYKIGVTNSTELIKKL